MLDNLWQRIQANVVGKSAIWPSSSINHLHEQSSSFKAFLREFDTMRRALCPSQAWSPWICETSLCTLAVNPFPTGRADLKLLQQSSIPVAVGAFHGQSLVVGIRIRAEGLLEDNVCFGIDAFDPDDGRSMSIMIAPHSGHCFIQCDNGLIMKTSALPALDVVPEMLRTWIQVTESGAVRFLRQVEDCEPVDAGFVGPEHFPLWIKEYYACLHVWGYDLQVATHLSIDHAAGTFPTWFADKPASEMGSIWDVLSEADGHIAHIAIS